MLTWWLLTFISSGSRLERSVVTKNKKYFVFMKKLPSALQNTFNVYFVFHFIFLKCFILILIERFNLLWGWKSLNHFSFTEGFIRLFCHPVIWLMDLVVVSIQPWRVLEWTGRTDSKQNIEMSRTPSDQTRPQPSIYPEKLNCVGWWGLIWSDFMTD